MKEWITILIKIIPLMIYIKRLDTCFLRIPKTGSQSLFLFVLNNLYDPKKDIISRKVDDVIDNNIIWANYSLFKTAHVDTDYLIQNNVISPKSEIVGVIRNPLEKHLSRYLYMIDADMYKNLKNLIEDFRKVMMNGCLSIERSHMNQSQCSFFKYQTTYVQNFRMLLFDDLENQIYDYFKEKSLKIQFPFPHINKMKTNTKELIDVFYSDELKQKVYDLYEEDFTVYEGLKNIHRL